VQLVIEHEQVRGRPLFGGRGGLHQFELTRIEERTEDLVHRNERGRHATRAAEKGAARDTEARRGLVRERGDARLDLALCRCLGEGHVLAVRDVACWHGGLQRVRRFGTVETLKLLA
jgi:hypothetical protein